MKAATRTVYGPPEVISVREIPTPFPKGNELLIRVHATTVNRTDCGILWGKPYLIRAFTGLLKPSSLVPGTDFSGVVEATGKNVTKFKPGDRVWGFDDEGLCSHAEYVCVKESSTVLKIPEGYSYEQAAASAEGAHYAYNFISKTKIKAGQKIIINGATGAIGSAAVQLLKALDVNVTATCKTECVNLVKLLGADNVIDYTKTDFTESDEKYHCVFDSVGKSEFGKCKKLLLPGGIYISSELGPGAENLYLPFITVFSKQKVIFPVPVNIKRSMNFVQSLILQGKFKPLIDRSFPLEKIAEAYHYVASGQKTGNVIIKY